MAAGVLEFLIESWLVPRLKQFTWISFTGCAMALAGEIVRKAGMVGAVPGHAVNLTMQESARR